MEQFAKMIYRNQESQQEFGENALYFEKGEELLNKLESILSRELFGEIYDLFTKGCMEVEENAFISGFEYACKCLSAGKIEFGKVNY